MKSKKILSLLAVAALATTILVGCGDKADANALKDGKYEQKGETDERGNTPEITIEVKDGKIATVKYDEVNADGLGKSENTEYNESMLSKGSPSSPATAFPELQDALVEKQDVAAVDAVTGVTSSSDSFKALATKALEEAK